MPIPFLSLEFGEQDSWPLVPESSQNGCGHSELLPDTSLSPRLALCPLLSAPTRGNIGFEHFKNVFKGVCFWGY